VSLRLRALNLFLRAVVKPQLRRSKDPAAARREFALGARMFLSSDGGMRRERRGAAPPVEFFRPDHAGARGIILYFHGGGYLAGSPATHRGMIARLSRETGLVVAAPDYRLAPEHPFPAAWDDAEAAWTALIAEGRAPRDIVLGGDSAGGGLALSLLARLCAAGTPPAGLVAFSPWTDLTGGQPALRENAARDPLLPSDRFGMLVDFVLAGHPADDPRASPLFADYPGCPPVLFQVSESEILRDDSKALAARLTASGATVAVQTWPDTPHAWPVLAGRIPEADAALRMAAAFIGDLPAISATGGPAATDPSGRSGGS
jgi:epsilon-lactone hydrolase